MIKFYLKLNYYLLPETKYLELYNLLSYTIQILQFSQLSLLYQVS